MRTAKIVLATATAFSFMMSAASMSAALAQQALTGIVTKIDRINGVIAVQQTQSGTVGANTGGAATAEEFKLQDSALLSSLHAGDRVTFSTTDNGGVKGIANLQKQ